MTSTLDTLMSDFVRRRRRMRATGAFCLMLAAIVAWLVVVGLIDRLLALPGVVRLILVTMLGVILLYGTFRMGQLLLSRRFDRLIAARQIEAMTPHLRDRLITIITQQALPPSQRGSAEMTQILCADVTRALVERPPEKLITDRHIAPAVIVLCIVALIAGGLAIIPWVGLPRLVARQLFPLSEMPPVTTTRIDVLTRNMDIPQGQPVAIVADVTDGPGDATLLIGASDASVETVAMPRMFADRFAITLPSVQRDTVYRVRSGDATSPPFHIRALTRPAIKTLTATLEFPAYLHRDPLTINTTEGRIEAVRGTRVTITLASTEPLAAASLDAGGQALPMISTSDPQYREARFTVERSADVTISMTSLRGVERTAETVQIVCIDDRPPVARFIRSDLRLAPTDRAAIPFQAIDDYGIDSMRLEVEQGGALRSSTQLDPGPEPRLIRDIAAVDLAAFDWSVGDVATMTLIATDAAGQESNAAVCHILISPRSIDAQSIRRIDALAEALKHVASMDSRPTQSLACLHALMRALATSDTRDLSDLIETQIDRCQQILSAQGADASEPLQVASLLRVMANDLEAAYRGQTARMLQAEIENVGVVDNPDRVSGEANRDARSESIARARDEIELRLAMLRLRPQAKDVAHQLRALIAREVMTYRDQHAPKATQIARLWEKDDRRSVQRDRVEMLARSQVLRADADLAWAADLQLIAGAMSKQEDRPPKDFLSAVDPLEQLHDLRGKAPPAGLIASASAAREKLKAWSGSVADASPRNSEDDFAELATIQATGRAASTGVASDRVWSRKIREKLESMLPFDHVFSDDLSFDKSVEAADILSIDRTIIPDWGRLRDMAAPKSSASAGEFVSQEYEEQLRMYFEALGKAKSGEN